MSKDEIIAYWVTSAKESAQIASESFANKHYDWAFFFWGLAIEKLLKGLMVKQEQTPLPIHDLQKLAKKANIALTTSRIKEFDEITTYCINARYDDYKRKFYNKVMRRAYRETWSKKCKEIILWLKNMY